MNREDVEKLRLIPGKANDLHSSGKSEYTVEGLEPHLQAEIRGGQGGYKYHLTRSGERYEQPQRSGTVESAFEALKRCSLGSPVRT